MATSFQQSRKPFLIRRTDQIAAIASPLRQEILDALQAAGPQSIAELAQILARPADGLYYHIRALLKAGLVVEHGARPTGRRRETIYDVPGDLRMVYRPGDSKNAAAVTKAAAAMLRLTSRDFAHAFRAGLAVG